MKHPIANGTAVKIDQGFNTFTIGVVRGYDNTRKNLAGFRGNYAIEITGGLDCFGNPAKVSEIRTVLQSHVSEV